jgi:hypothetical protein
LFVSHLSHTCYMPRPSHLPWFDHPNNIWWSLEVMKLLIMQSSPVCRSILPPPYVQIFSSTSCYQTPSIYVLTLMWETKFRTQTKQQIKSEFCTF